MSSASGIKPLLKLQSKIAQPVVGKRDTESISRSSSVSTLASVAESKEPQEDEHSFSIGERIWVNGTKPGIIEYIGKTGFAPGIWAGVCLDDPTGKNDGSLNGVKYFTCEPQKGIFIRPHRLTRQAGSPPSLTGDSSRRILENTPGPSLPPKSHISTPKGALANPNRHLCSKLKVGDRVLVSSVNGFKSGVLRFTGSTEFASGEWAGIELDLPVGKNDGSVEGKRYFTCEMKHGLFAPLSKISHESSLSGSKTPSVSGSIRSRSFSRESLNSVGSVSSSKSAAKVKLGVNSLGGGQKSPGATTTNKSIAQTALQETLKEKQEHIEQLLKERDLDREEVVKAAKQVEEVKQCLASFKKEHNSVIGEKETEIHLLKEQCDKIETERKQLSSKLDEERRKIEDLEFRLEEEKTVIRGDLENQVAKERGKIKELEALINNSIEDKDVIKQSQELKCMLQEKEISKLKADIENLNLEVKAKDQQIKQTIESLAEVKQQALSDVLIKAELDGKCKEMEQEIKDFHVIKSNLENDFLILKNTLKEQELKNEENLSEMERLKSTLKAKEEMIVEISSELKIFHDLKDTKEELEKQFFEKEKLLTSEIENFSQQNQDLESKLKDNVTELEEKDANIIQLNSKLDLSKKEIAFLKQGQMEQISKFQNMILELKNEIDEMNVKRIQIEDQYKLELETFSNQFKILEAKNDELHCSVEVKDNNLNKLKEELEETKKEIVLLSQGNSDQVLGLQDALSELKAQLGNLKLEHDQKEQSYKSQLDKLSESNVCLQAENEDLCRKLTNSKNDMQKLQLAFEEAEKRIALLHQSHSEQESSLHGLTSLKSEVADLKNNLEKVNKTFKYVKD